MAVLLESLRGLQTQMLQQRPETVDVPRLGPSRHTLTWECSSDLLAQTHVMHLFIALYAFATVSLLEEPRLDRIVAPTARWQLHIALMTACTLMRPCSEENIAALKILSSARGLLRGFALSPALA